MKIAYIRVSTKEQNEARQVELLKDECEKIFIDKASGKDTNRPELQRMLEFAREGDCIVVESYSRLARSLSDLLKIIEDMQSKGIMFISKKENIDTTTASGRFMLNIFASLAQFEREQLKERQAEGIEIAKKNGKYTGRKKCNLDEDEFIRNVKLVDEGEISRSQAARNLKISRNLFYSRYDLYKTTGKVNIG